MNARESNREKFTKFLKRDYDRMLAFVHTRYNEQYYKVPAEDVVQDVTMRVFSQLDLDRPVENIGAYVYRALRNRIIDLMRRPRVNRSIEDFTNDQGENMLMETLEDPDEENPYSDPEAHKNLMEAIGHLKPDEQVLIMETEFGDSTFEELSEKWDVPIGTLLSRKHRALQKLNKLLEKKLNNIGG